jgi:hypothetical protein
MVNYIQDPLLAPPYKFFVDADGVIYVPLQAENKIIAFDKYGKRVVFGNGADAISIDAPYAVYGNVGTGTGSGSESDSDLLYVLHRVNGIYSVNKKSGEMVKWVIKMDSYFQDPISACVMDELAFVALYKNDVLADVTSKICVYDLRNGKMLTYIESCTLPIALPQCVVCDNGKNGEGNGTDSEKIVFYVANNGKNLSKFEFGRKTRNIRQVDYTTDSTNIIYEDNMKIRDFAIDNDDRIYVSSNGLNYISVFGSDGEFIKNISFGELIPKHLFIRDQILYFTNVKGVDIGIYLFNLNGKPVDLTKDISMAKNMSTQVSTHSALSGQMNIEPVMGVVEQKKRASDFVKYDEAVQYVYQNISLYDDLIEIDAKMKDELLKPKSISSETFSATAFDYSAPSDSVLLITPYIFYLITNRLHQKPIGDLKTQAFVKKYALQSSIQAIYKSIQDQKELYDLFLVYHQEALYYKFNLKSVFADLVSGKIRSNSAVIKVYLDRRIFTKIEFEHKNFPAKDLIALLS